MLTGLDTLQHTCQLEASGTVVHPCELARLLPDVDIERIVFASPSRVIDVGVRRRLFTGGLRRAIEVRDRHCTHPGCEVPAHLCQVDHITEYAKGGPTTQANGRLRCAKHNRDRNNKTQRPPPTSDAA